MLGDGYVSGFIPNSTFVSEAKPSLSPWCLGPPPNLLDQPPTGSGSGLEFGGLSMDGLGFSEWVAAPTLLLRLGFNYGRGVRHKTRW